MDYTTLTFPEVQRGLRDVARDAQATFGHLDARRLNWRPDPARWSVAQCFEHLHSANQLMLRHAEDALRNPPTTVWQRVPILPGLFGRALIRSQGPKVGRKYVAPPKAQPTASDIAGDIVQRFADHQRETAEWMNAFDERATSRAIMVSPFIRVVTYSVMDGLRLMVAHDRRHFEQARRVTEAPGFPAP